LNDKPKRPDVDRLNAIQLFMNRSVPALYKVALVGGVLAYAIVPIDIIPEYIFGLIGVTDDVGVMIVAAQVFSHYAGKALTRQAALPDESPDDEDTPLTS
jgi:uncharacterized membrane protein YkvA (DUF1232 family)